MRTPDWIAVDWGTTRLRAWAMAADGGVLGREASQAGMATTATNEFEPALLSLIAPWLGDGRIRVIACGMVGARQGWVDAGYRAVPARPMAPPLVQAPVRDGRLDVRIVPGLSQERPADVMRGEETQIAGLLDLLPRFEGVVCLPGTHTKWAEISAGEVVSFRSFMTGEIFAALATATVLRQSVAAEGWEDDAFAEALGSAISQPERLAGELFSIRAGALLQGLSPQAARARLSGLLIGAELAGARPWWLGRRIALVGAEGAGARYEAALALQGAPVERVDAENVTLAGLARARALTETAAD